MTHLSHHTSTAICQLLLLLGFWVGACAEAPSPPLVQSTDTTAPNPDEADTPSFDSPDLDLDALGNGGQGPTESGQARECNGSASACQLPYPLVSVVVTHNAMANLEDGFAGPNQLYSVTRQLTDGVRGLMLDTHYDGEEVALCHGYCFFGSTPLLDTLLELEAFLRANPNEVLTVILESYVGADDTVAVFQRAGLSDYVYSHSGENWPTLGELIDGGQRLVVLSDHEAGSPAWYHDVWSLAWDTPFHAETLDDFTCDLGRGEVDNPLFILNHFLTAPIALEELARAANDSRVLSERIARCHGQHGRYPTLIAVDFYSLGAALTVSASLNERRSLEGPASGP